MTFWQAIRSYLRRVWNRFRFKVYSLLFGRSTIQLPSELRSFALESKAYRFRITEKVDLAMSKKGKLQQTLINYRSKAFQVCREYLQGAWKDLDEEQFRIHKISGGLSNHIFRCSLPKGMKPQFDEPADVLVRLFGEDNSDDNDITRYINSHVIDNVVFTILSERGLGPTLYGVFPEGRLEEFIPARSMSAKEVRALMYSEIIARKIAQVHSLSAPINKETKWMEKMMLRCQYQINEKTLADVKPEFHSLAVKLLSFDFEAEIAWLQKILDQVNSPIVFCHNDLQGGNILLLEHATTLEEKIMLIDYEFCSYNYRAYDLANHFSEWVYDYINNDQYPYYFCRRTDLPTKERMIDFFRAYLATSTHDSDHGSNSRSVFKLSPDEQTEILYREVQIFLLAPSLLWCMWAIVHSSNDSIPFGYWDYATDRMTDYLAHKKFLSNLGLLNMARTKKKQ